jgi:hypothetical protein
MKEANQTSKDKLRPEYRRSDFPKGLVRGKYAKRLRKSSNIVVLDPKVARAFPNQDAVNSALLSLIRIAERHSAKRTKKRQAGWRCR